MELMTTVEGCQIEQDVEDGAYTSWLKTQARKLGASGTEVEVSDR
jgi:hypothetical protein